VNLVKLTAESAIDFYNQLCSYLRCYKDILLATDDREEREKRINNLGRIINRENREPGKVKLHYAITRDDSIPTATNLDVKKLFAKIDNLAANSSQTDIKELFEILLDEYEVASKTPQFNHKSPLGQDILKLQALKRKSLSLIKDLNATQKPFLLTQTPKTCKSPRHT